MGTTIVAQRLHNQYVARPARRQAADLVAYRDRAAVVPWTDEDQLRLARIGGVQ